MGYNKMGRTWQMWFIENVHVHVMFELWRNEKWRNEKWPAGYLDVFNLKTVS